MTWYFDLCKDEEGNPRPENEWPREDDWKRHWWYRSEDELVAKPSTESKDELEPGTSTESKGELEPGASTESKDELEPGTSTESKDELEPGASTESKDELEPGTVVNVEPRRVLGHYDVS